MYIKDKVIIKIFNESLSPNLIKELNLEGYSVGGFNSEEVYWLNTPGPTYTTQTDNCGTGQIEALNNVGGDENYYEFIFKQPENLKDYHK